MNILKTLTLIGVLTATACSAPSQSEKQITQDSTVLSESFDYAKVYLIEEEGLREINCTDEDILLEIKSDDTIILGSTQGEQTLKLVGGSSDGRYLYAINEDEDQFRFSRVEVDGVLNVIIEVDKEVYRLISKGRCQETFSL